MQVIKFSRGDDETDLDDVIQAYKENHGVVQFESMAKLFIVLEHELAVKCCQTLHELESRFHDHDEAETLAFIKLALGTSSTAERYFDCVNNGFMTRTKAKISATRLFRRLTETRTMTYGVLIFRILIYYVDFIKDFMLMGVLAYFVSRQQTTSLSAITIVLVGLITCFIMTTVANILTLANNKSLGLSRKEKIVFCLLVPAFPAVAIYQAGKLKIEDEERRRKLRDLYGDLNQNDLQADLAGIEKYKYRMWKKISAEFRLNENVFENFPQVVLLLIASAIALSDTNTVSGLEAAFVTDNGELLIALSTLWSMRTLLAGQVGIAAMRKDGFIPIIGKIFLLLYIFITIFARTTAILLYVAPSLGLFNLMVHNNLGRLQFQTILESRTFDVRMYSENDQQMLTVKDAWEPVYDSIELVILPKTYFSIGLTLIFLGHFLISLWITRRNLSLKVILHAVSDFLCPMPFRDWDEQKQMDMEQQHKAFQALRIEMRFKVVLFAIVNSLMCIPLGFLYNGLSFRDEFLARIHFYPLEEELAATRKALTLLIGAPAVFLTWIPILQGVALYLFYQFGHPWAKLGKLLNKKKATDNNNM